MALDSPVYTMVAWDSGVSWRKQRARDAPGMPRQMRTPYPVITAVSNVLAHAPGLVRYGSRPFRDLRRDPGLADRLAPHLRPYEEALAYPPNQAYIGNLDPDALRHLPRPWFRSPIPVASREGPFGVIISETELLSLLHDVDRARLVHLRDSSSAADLDTLLGRGQALPLWGAGELTGCMTAGHDEDEALTANVLLENLACKATAVLALRELFRQLDGRVRPTDVPFIISGSEEAVGDRYQRGGGNLAKAIGEAAGLSAASGMDVKAFCASTLYALVTAAAYVHSGLFDRVAVVAGGSLAKLGMKYRAHVDKGLPILEDVLAGVAILVEAPHGGDPRIRLDTVSRHRIDAGSSQQAVVTALAFEPLAKAGYGLPDVDKYVTEMHNPEVTEPAGSGDVPATNYRLIAGLGALRGDLGREDMPVFVREHGIPGYAPTQGHIASAVCYLAHACQAMRAGKMRRALFMAKGSLFLGRMTELSDGLGLLVEASTEI